MASDNEVNWENWEKVAVAQIGAAVREFRDALGMSQAELATSAGISKGQIMNLESTSGRVTKLPGVGTVVRLAYAMGIPPVALLYPGLPSGKVEMLPGITTTSIKAVQWFSGENAQIPGVKCDPTRLMLARRYAALQQAQDKLQTDDALVRLGVEDVGLSAEGIDRALSSIKAEFEQLKAKMDQFWMKFDDE